MEDTLGLIFYYGKIALMIVVAFGILIFIHELGHFLAAKLMGVGATDFALGMGPELFGFQWGETRCKLCLFPIGGYVKLIGEEDDDVPAELQHKNLRAKKTWQKVLVIFAGPFMNYVLAVALFIIVLLVWGMPRELPTDANDFKEYEMNHIVVAGFVDPRKPAGKAGIQKGDTILEIDGTRVENELQIDELFKKSKGNPVTVTVLNETGKKHIRFKPKKVNIRQKNTWWIGIQMAGNTSPPEVLDLVKNSAAERSGMQRGDVILSIDGAKINKTTDVSRKVRKARERAIVITVQRGAKKHEIRVVPEKVAGGMKTKIDTGITGVMTTPRLVSDVAAGSPAAEAGLKKGDIILSFDLRDQREGSIYTARERVTDLLVYRRGAAPATISFSTGKGKNIGLTMAPVNRRFGFIEAVQTGSVQSVNMVFNIVIGFWKMITREVPADDIAGPVGIVHYAFTFARYGLMYFIDLFAAISVCLFIINLLPFPALDGSHIMFFLWEGITRRPLNPQRQATISYVGLCILFGLIILVTFKDLRLLLGI